MTISHKSTTFTLIPEEVTVLLDALLYAEDAHEAEYIRLRSTDAESAEIQNKYAKDIYDFRSKLTLA